MLKHHTRAFLFLTTLFYVYTGAEAQISITANQTAQHLVQRLVGSNVAAFNAILNCPTQHNGQFTTISSNLGLSGGIILATGTATSLAGPWNQGMTQSTQTGGDGDLSALVGGATTNDACVLEFDFVPDVDSAATLSFEYAFGSEEYPGYACTQYNDVFGFLLSGPTYSPPVNIAKVPGTNIPVTINSINNGTPGTAGGDIATCQAMGPGSPFTQYYVDNKAQNGQTIALPGFTTVLQAQAIVYPCDTYHMKLGVANLIDHGLNSAVFIKENSFTVDTVKLDLAGIISADSGYLVEGCTPAVITATRTQSTSRRKKICLSYGGTAVNGIDYTFLADTLIIPPNSMLASMILNPIQDNMTEPGFETVVIRRLNCCSKEPIDSIEIKIRDSLKMELLSVDTAICGRDTVRLQVTGDPSFTYLWSPPMDVANPSDTFTTAFPAVTTVYTVTATFQSCPSVSRSFTAGVEPVPIVTISPHDTAFCLREPYQFSVDVQPYSFTNYNYTWAPNLNLDNPFIKEPKFFIPGAGEFKYVLSVKTPLGCIGKDSITVITRPAITLTNVTPDFIVKYGDIIQLNATGADYYTWTPDKFLDFPNTQEPKATALDSVTFQVIGMNMWGCKDTAYVKMGIDYSMFEIIPSAFSPNNDNRNDVFHIGHLKFQRLLEFSVYNRWGQQVFNTIDPLKGWDGTFNGVPQEAGVYNYIIRLATPDGKTRTYKGDVTLIR